MPRRSRRMQLQLSRGRSWALALTATLTLAVSYVDRQTFAVLAPTWQEQLHISDKQYGDWLAPAFSYAYLVGAPLAGYLIDRIGARRGLLGAVLLWSLVAALHALAPGFGALFALRLALGVAESPSFPGAAQTIQRGLSPVDRARGYGLLFSGSSLGAMIAPLLAPYLNARWGYQVAFLGTAVVGLSWVPFWLLAAYTRPARDVLDRVVEPQRSTSPRSILTVAKSPAMIRAALVIFASAPLLNLYMNWGSKYLVHDHLILQGDVGKYLWFGPLLYDAGSIFFGHLASLARARGSVAVPRGLLLSAMVLTCAGALVPNMSGPVEAMIVASVSMAGGGGLYALTTSDLMARIPATWVSTAGGLCATAQSLAYIGVSPLIGRSVNGTTPGTGAYGPSLFALTAWAVPLCVIWCLWRLPDPDPETTAKPT